MKHTASSTIRCTLTLFLAGFMVSNTQSKQVTEEKSSTVRNTWYENFRPTHTFMSLEGTWQVVQSVGDRNNLWKQPDLSDSRSTHVPELKYPRFGEKLLPESEDIRMTWYSYSFELDDKIKRSLLNGDDVILHIGGVSWRWSLWLNDHCIIDGCYDVFNSQDIEVTSLLNPQGENKIKIAATDNHGLAENLKHAKRFNPSIKADRNGDFIAPAPETNSDPFVWGEIELWARPHTRIEDLFVRPDFRNKKLDIDLELLASTPAVVHVNIVDMNGNKASVPFTPQPVEKAAQSEIAKTTLTASWPSPRLWEPEDPFLYFAEVTLTHPDTGKLIDQRNVRFGFRELWIDGGDLMMNGKRLFLARRSLLTGNEHVLVRGSSSGSTVREQMQSLVTQWENHNSINSLRYHRCGFIRPGALASYADELGLLLIPEAGYCMGGRFAVKNPLFWENCSEYLKAWIKSGRNHPSIVMWSLTNEFIWCGAQRKNPDCHTLMYEQEKLVKSIDPTRFVGWDGDWDLQANGQLGPGWSETVNLHYPNECSKHWYPTECWRLNNASIDNPVPVRGHNRNFTWAPDSKPLVVGEYSWNNRNYFEGPENMTKYAGDRAYDWEYWITGKLPIQVVKWQTDAWRVQRYAGLNPWISKAKGYESLMPRETVILRNDPTVYHSGSKLSLPAYLLNDTLRDRDYVVRWKLLEQPGSKETATAEQKFSVIGGEMEPFNLTLTLPQVASPTDCTLQISVERDKRILNVESYALRIRPCPTLTWPEEAVLYDPEGSTTDLLNELNIAPQKITHLSQGFSDQCIVLGQNALSSTLSSEELDALENYVYQGGTILTLGEDRWPKQGLGPSLIFKEEKANHAWVRSKEHPILSGISNQDLGFWGADHWINQTSVLKPASGTGVAWRTLIDVGSREGLQGAVLIELFSGKGRYIFNFLDFSKAQEAPGARALLSNLLKDITREIKPRNAVSLMMDDNHPLTKQLRESSIRTTEWDPKDPTPPLFITADNERVDPKEIATWVTQGGKVWLMDLNDSNVTRWENVFPEGLKLKPDDSYDGARIIQDSPWLWGVSNEEFFTCNGVWDNRPSSNSKSPRGSKIVKTASLSEYKIEAGADSMPLLHPAYLVEIRMGKGTWLLSTLNLDEGMIKTRQKTGRFIQAMMTNFGLESSLPPFKNAGDFKSIDLSAHVNRAFQDDVAQDGTGGWFDQGFHVDLHFFPQNISGVDLANLPMPAPSDDQWPSNMTISEIPFNIIDPRNNHGKSCIVLSPGDQPAKGLVSGDLPSAIKGIQINRHVDFLYSLHASAYAKHLPPGTQLWTYILRYKDGSSAEIPIRLNVETADWHRPSELPGATVGWTGPTMKIKPVGLYVAKLNNPNPTKEVLEIDIISSDSGSISGIVGLTTGSMQK